MSEIEIDVSKCPYKGGLECHIRDYPIEYCADVKIEDCHYKQLQRYKQVVKEIKEIAENNMDDKQIMAVQIMLNGSPDVKNEVLKQIIQKCEEVNEINNR